MDTKHQTEDEASREMFNIPAIDDESFMASVGKLAIAVAALGCFAAVAAALSSILA